MSQAEAPRVYKFVGAFSRKRRRRDVAVKPTAANGRTAVTSPVCDKHAASPMVPALSSGDPGSLNRYTLDRPTHHDDMPSIECAPEARAIPPTTPTNCEVTEAVTQPSIESFCQVQDPDWSCPSLLNPFFDLELPILHPFQYIDSNHQLPVDLNVDGAPTQLGNDCTNSNAPLSQNDGISALFSAEEVVFRSFATDDLLPSPGLQGASYDISLTISQVLTRCKIWND